MERSEKQMRILWIDDEIKELIPCIEALELDGAEITTAVSTQEAWGILEEKKGKFSTVISDLLMPPPSSPLDFLKKVYKKYPKLSLVVVSGYLDTDEYRRGLRWLKKDMNVTLIEKPLPKPGTEGFHVMKEILLGGGAVGRDFAARRNDNSILQKACDALELNPRFLGVGFDIKKFFISLFDKKRK